MCDQSLVGPHNADIQREWRENLQFKPRKVPSRGKSSGYILTHVNVKQSLEVPAYIEAS